MSKLAKGVGLVVQAPTMLRVLTSAGVVRLHPPLKLARVGATLLRWGTGPAGGFAAMAILDPDRPGVVDELGELTFGELHDRSNRLADALRSRGVGPGDAIAIMCRNHRGFVDASIAAAKLGADILYLNTAFAGPQLVDVLERENPQVVVHDEEFTAMLEEADTRDRVLGWVDAPDDDPDAVTLESLIAQGSPGDHPAPAKQSRIIILTSGTTGTPKGAPRSEAGIEAAAALLSRLPLKSGWRSHVAAPLFHTWGWAHFALAMLLGSTVVLRRKFDPEGCLRTLVEEDCDSLVVIPVMLQRIMQLPQETLDALRPVGRQGRRGVRVGAARRPRHQLDGPVRRPPVQHLRLHRGRLRHDRQPGGPPRGTRYGGPPAVRDGGEDPRRGRRRAAPGRGRPDLRRQQHPVRGLHRRRQQGPGRRPDGHR